MLSMRNKRPDLRRDCDVEHIAAIIPYALGETNDLIYEGIATLLETDLIVALSETETNDLIYEGIATTIDLCITIDPCMKQTT